MKARKLLQIRVMTDWFIQLLQRKLMHAKNIRKPIWSEERVDYLLDRLDQEVVELKRAIVFRHSDNDIIDECVDVAAFAAMIADKHRTTIGKSISEEHSK